MIRKRPAGAFSSTAVDGVLQSGGGAMDWQLSSRAARSRCRVPRTPPGASSARLHLVPLPRPHAPRPGQGHANVPSGHAATLVDGTCRRTAARGRAPSPLRVARRGVTPGVATGGASRMNSDATSRSQRVVGRANGTAVPIAIMMASPRPQGKRAPRPRCRRSEHAARRAARMDNDEAQDRRAQGNRRQPVVRSADMSRTSSWARWGTPLR